MDRQLTLQIETVVSKLRASCPWNMRQSPWDLVLALEAEIGELREAVACGASWKICEELGDVLFNLVSLAECMRERDLFDLTDVDTQVARKMVERHPYVFSTTPDPGAEEAERQWQIAKAHEVEQRRANRTGLAINCEVYQVPHWKLSDERWLRHLLKCLAEELGVDPRADYHSTRGYSATPNSGYLLGLADPPYNVTMQAFPADGLLLIQAFSVDDLAVTQLRTRIAELCNSEDIDILAVERGRAPMSSAQRGGVQ